MVDRVAGVQPFSMTIMTEREAMVELREDDPIINAQWRHLARCKHLMLGSLKLSNHEPD